jgi:hypothetical protein
MSLETTRETFGINSTIAHYCILYRDSQLGGGGQEMMLSYLRSVNSPTHSFFRPSQHSQRCNKKQEKDALSEHHF